LALKILLVDDEADIVEVVQDRLEHYGFTVITAGTGLDALQKLATEAFDGIFLDIKMPEMDGMEALGEIRKRDMKIPVIILTASSTQDTAIEAMNRGANDYILKPLEWDELKVKIEKLYHLTLR
jgi:DNA-binding response OmpR family regulator